MKGAHKLRILLSDEIVGVLRQMQVIWQFAPAVLRGVNSHDRAIVYVLFVAILIELLLGDWHDFFQGRFTWVHWPWLGSFKASLRWIASQTDFESQSLYTRFRSSLSQVWYISRISIPVEVEHWVSPATTSTRWSLLLLTQVGLILTRKVSSFTELILS